MCGQRCVSSRAGVRDFVNGVLRNEEKEWETNGCDENVMVGSQAMFNCDFILFHTEITDV